VCLYGRESDVFVCMDGMCVCVCMWDKCVYMYACVCVCVCVCDRVPVLMALFGSVEVWSLVCFVFMLTSRLVVI
jgi:hypothetical protein